MTRSWLGPHPCELQQIGHGELPARWRYGGRGLPDCVQGQVRVGVALHQGDEGLSHDTPADRAHLAPAADDLRLLQDVEPQRRIAVPSRILEERLEILVLDVELAQTSTTLPTMGTRTSMR